VRIFNSINAKLSIEPRFGCNAYECRSNITIVGINDTPEPRYIRNMTAIIGAVCGAATAVPCALLIARFIRSVRRSNSVYPCFLVDGLLASTVVACWCALC
jgi:hypothetical protein